MTNTTTTKWKKHTYRVGTSFITFDEDPDPAKIAKYKREVEPWLAAILQTEHFSLLLGSGFTIGVASYAGTHGANMAQMKFNCELEDKVNEFASKSAARCGRGVPNIEDQLRAAITLLQGLEVAQDDRVSAWRKAINEVLANFLNSVLTTERDIAAALEKADEKGLRAASLLTSFLLTFGSRVPSRDRLHVFTTNYERVIEFGCDLVGLRTIDRFIGSLLPIFRSSRIDIDIHYNPPGIRGEPRYLEGVLKLTKLHGSLDWRFVNGNLVRVPIGFGASEMHPDVIKDPLETVMIYPNPAKDIETGEYPYAELFRDFSAALCRPNSALVTFGYGFGDDHINRVIRDMLAIPSTHLVVIAFGDPDHRVESFCDHVGRPAQISLLVGPHFGDLGNLVDHYLPKPAIDYISIRRAELLKNRGQAPEQSDTAQNAGTKQPAPGGTDEHTA